jgi:hypothetical protein
MDDTREIGRTVKAAERVLGWCTEEAATLERPGRLYLAQAQLLSAAAQLIRVDRERAQQEAGRDLAALRGDEALIAEMIRAALLQALDDEGPRPPRRPAGALRAAA